MIKKLDVFELACLWVIGLVALFFLYGCGSPVEQPDTFATQTPHVVTATDAPTLEPSATTEPTATLDCPPRYLENITVGYIPVLDLGEKKTPALASIGCAMLVVYGEGWSLSGQVSQDGLSLVSCVLSADRDYPCQLVIRNLAEMNIVASFQNKAGKNYDVCLGVSSKDYTEACDG